MPKRISVLKINASPIVELVESGKFINNKRYCKNKINSILQKPLTENAVDIVTLSSTHLPFILPMLRQLFPKIQFLDPAEKIAIKIMNRYNRKISKKNSFSIYSSGKIRLFQSQLALIGVKTKVKPLKIN